MQLLTGLNPYGLTYSLGLQGRGTPRANPRGRGLEGFVAIAEELGARTLEIFAPWLAPLDDDALRALRDRLAKLKMMPVISASLAMTTGLADAFRPARLLDATVIRLGLSSVLCGERSAWGDRWGEINTTVRAALRDHAPRAADAGIVLAIENHQDFGSQELVDFCDEAGPGVGITFDTGNAFPVAEAPLDFTHRIAPLVRHVHLKDYRVQFTDEGYRLVRCAIGDGAVPFAEIMETLARHHDRLTAALEPGALEARHIRLFTPAWWSGYAPKSATELAACLRAARRNLLAEDEDYRTPWERQDDDELEQYELDMIRRSAANMRAIGIMANGAELVSKELSGMTAFVTGSGRGLGHTMAMRLAERGADVAVHDLSWDAPAKYGEAANLGEAAARIEALGVRTVAVSGNIGDKDAVAGMKREIEAKLGDVHILVNCAGGDIGAAGGKPNPNNALDIALEDVQTLTTNNLIGTMLVCQAFVPNMVRAGSGTVVNIASVAGHYGCSPGVVYATLKAAVIHYTRCLAKELLADGVRVNAVSPGPTKTARFQATRPLDPKKMDSSVKSFDRYAEPDEIADAVAFLAGPQSRFINGQVLCVDGGLTLFPG